MIKLTNILKEMRLNEPGNTIFPKKYIEDLMKIISDEFGSGHSDTDIIYPVSETYKLNDYEDDDKIYKIFNRLLGIYENKKFVSKDIFDTGDWSWIKNTPDKFATLIEFGDDNVTISTPNLDIDGNIFTGWFDRKGKYHPDTEHFTEYGERK